MYNDNMTNPLVSSNQIFTHVTYGSYKTDSDPFYNLEVTPALAAFLSSGNNQHPDAKIFYIQSSPLGNPTNFTSGLSRVVKQYGDFHTHEDPGNPTYLGLNEKAGPSFTVYSYDVTPVQVSVRDVDGSFPRVHDATARKMGELASHYFHNANIGASTPAQKMLERLYVKSGHASPVAKSVEVAASIALAAPLPPQLKLAVAGGTALVVGAGILSDLLHLGIVGVPINDGYPGGIQHSPSRIAWGVQGDTSWYQKSVSPAQLAVVGDGIEEDFVPGEQKLLVDGLTERALKAVTDPLDPLALIGSRPIPRAMKAQMDAYLEIVFKGYNNEGDTYVAPTQAESDADWDSFIVPFLAEMFQKLAQLIRYSSVGGIIQTLDRYFRCNDDYLACILNLLQGNSIDLDKYFLCEDPEDPGNFDNISCILREKNMGVYVVDNLAGSEYV